MGKDLDVLAAAVHDIKTPLSLIYSLAEELKLDNPTPEIAAIAPEKIAEASQRAINLLDAVVAAQKSQAGQLELSLAPIAVEPIVNDVAYELASLADATNHALDVRISRRLPTVMGNKSAFRRALFTLMDISIRSAEPARPVRIDVKKVKQGVSVTVVDSSSGVRPKEWQKIIERPGQSFQPSPALGDRSGISLFVTKQLTSAMGGEFELVQAKGHNQFVIRLPQIEQLRLV